MLRSSNVLRGVGAALLTMLVTGCGGVEDTGSANFSTIPAKGKVTVGGKPVTTGIIVLEPLADGGSTQQASGEIKSDGSFELMSPGKKTGAMPGTYRVKVESEQVKSTTTKAGTGARPRSP